VAELAFGHGLAFQGLDDLQVSLPLAINCSRPFLSMGAKAAGKHGFERRRSSFLSLGRIPNVLFPALTVPDLRQNQKPKFCSRLGCAARDLASGDLLNAGAVAASPRLFWAGEDAA
jgi:hypothetical protein